MVTFDSIISMKSAPLYSEFGEAVVIMDIETGRYYSFENVARDIWKNIAAPIKVSNLCEQLIAEYDAPPDHIRKSVLAFLQKLQEHELILAEAGSTDQLSGP